MEDTSSESLPEIAIKLPAEVSPAALDSRKMQVLLLLLVQTSTAQFQWLLDGKHMGCRVSYEPHVSWVLLEDIFDMFQQLRAFPPHPPSIPKPLGRTI